MDLCTVYSRSSCFLLDGEQPRTAQKPSMVHCDAARCGHRIYLCEQNCKRRPHLSTFKSPIFIPTMEMDLKGNRCKNTFAVGNKRSCSWSNRCCHDYRPSAVYKINNHWRLERGLDTDSGCLSCPCRDCGLRIECALLLRRAE